MTRRYKARLGLGSSRSAGKRPYCRRQTHKIKPLAFEPFRSAVQPILDWPLRATLEGDLDQSGVTAVQAAEEVDGIGKIATAVTPRRFEQASKIGMASTSLARDSRELDFGNADRFVADGPIDRHSSPLVCLSGEALFRRC
jgi:hypothetical protein